MDYLEARLRWLGEQIEGRVSKVSREGRIVSNVVVYDVMVEPDEVPPHWSSGMTANVEFLTTVKSDILAIPKGAVREEDGRQYVLVLNKDPEPRPIETGLSDGKVVEVTRGLMEGDTIIVGEMGSDEAPRPRSDLRRQMPMIRPPR